MDNLPADPRTFATRHIAWNMCSPILQEILSVTILPCNSGTDFLHQRGEIKAFSS